MGTTKTDLTSRKVEKLTGSQFTKRFDELCNSGKLDQAQQYLDSLATNIKKWQKLNFQAIIEYKRNNPKRLEALLREAAREPSAKEGVKKILLVCW